MRFSMKNHHKCVCAATGIVLAAFAGGGAPVMADLVQANLPSRNQAAFDAGILANDLIENGSADLSGAPVTTGAVSTYGGDVQPLNAFDHLTDGAASSNLGSNDISHDTYFDTGAYATNPTITYNLNIGAHPNGYTLTSINSIAGWANTDSFSHQDYNVSVSYANAPSTFVQVAAVNYTPDFTGLQGSGNASQVTLTASTLTELAGVASIRFAILNNGGNGQVFREIDVVGAPTVLPEPATLGIVGLAGMLLLARRRRAAR